MAPKIRSRQQVDLVPRAGRPVTVGQVVLARVRGRLMLHQVAAVDGHRVQIRNLRGHVNGWTDLDRVYGLAVAVDGTALSA